MQRTLDQSRQNLDEAYERARAAGYRPGSAAMTSLEDAERRYQHARTLARDPHHQDADPAGQRPGGEPLDNTIDLTPSEQPVDLHGSRPPAAGR